MTTQNETAVDQDAPAKSVYEILREDLLAGRFEPGTKLRVEELSARYGIGASPLREALSKLSASGLVAATPQRGYRVAAVSRQEYRDLVEMRLLLETHALSLSIAKGDVEWEAGVVAAYHRLARAHSGLATNDVEAYIAWATADRAFHKATIANCGSPWLLQLCQIIFEQTARYHREQRLRGVAPVEKTRSEHKRLMEAVVARDIEKAITCLHSHIRNVAVRVERDVFDSAV